MIRLKPMHILLPVFLLVTVLFSCSCKKPKSQPVAKTPEWLIPALEEISADTLMTEETRLLWMQLKMYRGKGILFGQQEATITGVDWKNLPGRSDVKSLTGTYPAVHGYELSGVGNYTNMDSIPFDTIRVRMIQTFNRGGINTATWHMNNPVTGGTAWDNTPAAGQILPDSSLEESYKKMLKDMAAFFRSLRTSEGRSVPVIFRPFHESNGNWFWWGKGQCDPEQYVKLWRFTVSYLRDSLHVHNLLYAYSTDMFENREQYMERYPGDEWVDIMGCENYRDFQSGTSISNGVNQLRMLVDMADKRKKIAALTECGFNGIPVKNWWTQFLLKPIREDSLARNISYMMVWKNANPKQYYTPFEGQKSAADFIVFEKDSFTLFERDIR